MCDNLTSSATEDSCHFCDSWQQCRGAGCIWDQSHTSCIEGRDHFSVLCAGLICMFGWCFVIWCVGWLIKDTGQVSQLRRYGVQVTGEVVGRWTEQEVVRTLEGYSVVVNSYYAMVEFARPPPVARGSWRVFRRCCDAAQNTLLRKIAMVGMGAPAQDFAGDTVEEKQALSGERVEEAQQDTSKRVPELLAEQSGLDSGDAQSEVAAHLLANVQETKTAVNVAELALAKARRRESKRGMENYNGLGHRRAIKERRQAEQVVQDIREQLLQDEWMLRSASVCDGETLVQVKIKCSMKLWNKWTEGRSARVVFDPLRPDIVVPAVTVEGHTMNRWVLLVVGFLCSIALIGGGVDMLRSEHHCGELPECCTTPTVEIADKAESCAGLRGRTHGAACWGTCSSQWVMWSVMGSMFGFMAGLILVLLRSMGSFRSDTALGKMFDVICGVGEFCVPEAPKK